MYFTLRLIVDLRNYETTKEFFFLSKFVFQVQLKLLLCLDSTGTAGAVCQFDRKFNECVYTQAHT